MGDKITAETMSKMIKLGVECVYCEAMIQRSQFSLTKSCNKCQGRYNIDSQSDKQNHQQTQIDILSEFTNVH